MNYTATGTINVGGCADFELIFYYNYRYAIGSIVYSVPKAKKGIFEKHAVKDVRFGKDDRERDYPPLYIDSFNAYWNEEELCTFEDAVAFVESYLTTYEANLEAYSRNRC